MFCPYCGTESTQGLNYCNRCGANLGVLTQGGAQDARPVVSNGAAWAAGTTMTMLVIFGLGVVLMWLAELSHTNLPPGVIVSIMIAGAATVLGAAGVLARFWMQLLTGGRPGKPSLRPPARPSHTNELGPPRQQGALPDSPIPSITEQTTRTLDRAKK